MCFKYKEKTGANEIFLLWRRLIDKLREENTVSGHLCRHGRELDIMTF